LNSQILFYQNPEVKKRALPLIIVITLLFSLLIIAITPPATGYELSIYGAYPAFLWVLISINIFFSFYAIFQSWDDKTRNWIYSYFSILLLETTILLLPITRGYYSMSRGGGDIYHHLFIASFISNSGYFPQTDMYPIMHILLSILQISLLDWFSLAILLEIIFFLLYILYLYILGKTILGSKKGGIFVSLSGIPLIFSFLYFAFIPYLFALFTVPLILYAYQKIITTKNRSVFYICLVIFSLFIVFCHPSVTVFLLSTFFIFILFELWSRRRDISHHGNIVAINILTLLFITFSFWFIQFRYLMSSGKKIINALFGQYEATTIIEYQIDMIKTADASIWLIITQYVKVYGPITLYFLISFLFTLYLIRNYYHQNKIDVNDFIYTIQFCGAFCIGILMTVSYTIIFEPIRAASYGIFFASIICGIFMYRIWDSIHTGKQKMRYVLSLAVIMTLVCMLCIFNVYSSPWKSSANTALSHGEKNGINWILEYREDGTPLVREDWTMRYSQYYYGVTSPRALTYLSEYAYIIPSNFGYNTNRTIGEAFAYLPDKKVYMVTTEMMKLLPFTVPVERRDRIKQFGDADFNRLKNDPNINLIYSNNGLEVWSAHIL